MSNKIYAVAQPPREIKVSSSEQEEYLNCKFWKITRDEAVRFLCFYIAPLHQLEGAQRAIGLISGDLLRVDCPDDFFNQTDFVKIYEALLSVISTSSSYPGDFLIDDIIVWATDLQIMNLELADSLKREIANVRGNVFKKPPTENIKIQTLKLLLDRSVWFVLYDDIKEILSLEKHVFLAFQKAVMNDDIPHAYNSKNKQIFYAEPRGVIKWLMRQGYFPEKWIEHFKDLKKESIKETIYPTPQTLTLGQLQRLLEKKYSGNEDIYYHVNNGLYNAYVNVRDELSCSYIENSHPLTVKNNLYNVRYSGLERLLPPSQDHEHVAKKLLDGTIIKATKYSSFIFLDSTHEEQAFGLQRIFSFRKNGIVNVYNELTPEDLRFVVDEIEQGLGKGARTKKTNSKRSINGKLSGQIRKEESEKNWTRLQPALIDIAQKHSPTNANKIACLAVKNKHILPSELSNTAKNIRLDKAFLPFFKKRP